MSLLDCVSVAEVIGACSYAVVRGWLELTYRTPTLEQAKERYRKLALTNHSDQGGSDARMAELNGAWESAQRELK